MLQAEVAWIENTLSTPKESTMQTYDIKKDRKDLYAPKAVDFRRGAAAGVPHGRWSW
jgi:hypothetical protein